MNLPDPTTRRPKATQHNHVTRDIQPLGQCPACDDHHNRNNPAVRARREQAETRPVSTPTPTIPSPNQTSNRPSNGGGAPNSAPLTPITPIQPITPVGGAPAPAPAQPRKPQLKSEVTPTPLVARPANAHTIDYSDTSKSDDVLIDDMLQALLDAGGSDLHLTAKNYPTTRINGDIEPLKQFRKLSGEDIEKLASSIMTTNQRNEFEETWELDFAYELSGKSRFRVNVFKQQREVGVVMRAIPWEIKTVEQLQLPEVMKEWANLPRGLVLVTGPTGSGKSTTLAAIIDHANSTRKAHIMTIEDPVEFVHTSKMSIVNQREVGVDTKSFAQALKRVLRQDPDIILVGEMRDYETISIALSAAETGHLVFGTLHTQSAKDTINRIIDVFPEEGQAQVRTQLANTIQGIACQTLLKTYDGKGRIAATEILVARPNITANIRQGKVEQITSYMQTGASEGMYTLDDRLLALTQEGKIRWQDALEKAANRARLLERLGGEEGAMRLDRRIQQERATTM